jgi:hypothetical protein
VTGRVSRPTAALVVVLYALLVGGFSLASQFVIDLPGALGVIWDGSALGWAIVLLGVPVGFASGRIWALLPALAPLVVAITLQLVGYEIPWHDAGPPLDMWAVVEVVFWAAPLTLGVALRVTWDGWRSPQRPRGGDSANASAS